MAYASAADVANLHAKFPTSATSKPTTTQAGFIIVDISNEIDVALAAQGVSVPVTAPQYFVDWLGILNAYGAAAAILKSMFPDATGAAESPAYAFWEKRYQEGLASLRDGSGIPPEIVGSGSNYVRPTTYLTENPDEEYDLGEIGEPFFTRDKVF